MVLSYNERKPDMDDLLRLLKQNARFSNEQLAAMLNTTPQEVAEKIAEYERGGMIMGYSAILNEELCDSGKVTAVIELRVTPRADGGFDDFAKTIMMYDEVESVVLMSGAYDLSVTVTSNSLRNIAEFVARRLSTIDGILSTATHFVLKTYKDKGIFIENEADDERSYVSP